ncbi:MAG: hypothetical protein AAF431_12505 [Pseudomonadota bacterium]
MEFNLIERIAEGPQWVYWWTRVIDTSNWLLVPFAFYDRRALWALFAWVVNIIIILSLYNIFGYVRILGLSHIIAWTPLLIYLWKARKPFALENWTGRYLYWFMVVIAISLAFDYVDLVRYLSGDINY